MNIAIGAYNASIGSNRGLIETGFCAFNGFPSTKAFNGVTNVYDFAQLQARVDAGETLTPVEQGTLARYGDEYIVSAANAALSVIAAVAPLGAATALAATAAAQSVAGPTAATPTSAATGPKVKTIDDFTLTNASAQDIADFKATLEYLQSTDENGKVRSQTAVDLLAKLPAGQTINFTHNDDDSFDPNTGIINWDPRSGLVVNSGQGTQSAALGFIHEVDHAVNGLSSIELTGDGYENTEEKRVITGTETTIARDFNEPTRTDHGGSTTLMSSSTDHSYYNKGLPAPLSSELSGYGPN